MKRISVLTTLVAVTTFTTGCGYLQQWRSRWSRSSYECCPSSSSSFDPIISYGPSYGSPAITPPNSEIIPAPRGELTPIPETQP